MNQKTVRPEAAAFQLRFFQALNTLIQIGEVDNLQQFCETHKLHRPKYSRLRSKAIQPEKQVGYKFIDIHAPAILVKDYKVSGDWLMVEEGEMFRR